MVPELQVGNVWCSISPAYKLKDLYSTDFLAKMWYVPRFLSDVWSTVFSSSRHEFCMLLNDGHWNISVYF